MRLAVIAGDKGSGGYHRYINGIFGEGNVPSYMDIKVLCTKNLAANLVNIDNRIDVCIVDDLQQNAASFFFAKLPGACIDEVESFAPDVVMFSNGFIQKGLDAYPAVITFHNLLTLETKTILANRFSRTTLLRIIQATKQRKTFKKAAGVIFLTPYSQTVALRKVPGINKSIVIPHGLDETFRIETPANKTAGDRIRVIYVSTIFEYKHQLEVVRAVHELQAKTAKPVTLTLVGGGDASYIAKLRAEVSRLKAEEYIELLGDRPHAELPNLLDKANIFLYASSCEMFGITLLEAMGRGAVIACSNLTGLPDLLRDGGEYFDPRDPHSICLALEHLMASPSLCEQYSHRAHEYSKGYSWAKSAERTFEFIREVGESR